MPYQKISKVIADDESGMLYIYGEDGCICNYGIGCCKPIIEGWTQYGVAVLWIDPRNKANITYKVNMINDFDMIGTIFEGAYLPEYWKDEVKREYIESQPRQEKVKNVKRGNIESSPKSVPRHNEEFPTGLIFFVGCVFAFAINYFVEYSPFYTLVAFFIGGVIPVFILKGLKDGIGCSVLVVIVFGVIIAVGGGVPPLNFRSSDAADNQMNAQNTMVVSKDVDKQKIPAYLQGVDNISSNHDLSNFYFSVANKFYHNDMGLKGTQEQIDAGNNLMVRVYDFLGTSARRKMLNIDSMKAFVKNYAGVSDFRRKKALEDLQMGVDKIESLNE